MSVVAMFAVSEHVQLLSNLSMRTCAVVAVEHDFRLEFELEPFIVT